MARITVGGERVMIVCFEIVNAPRVVSLGDCHRCSYLRRSLADFVRDYRNIADHFEIGMFSCRGRNLSGVEREVEIRGARADFKLPGWGSAYAARRVERGDCPAVIEMRQMEIGTGLLSKLREEVL